MKVFLALVIMCCLVFPANAAKDLTVKVQSADGLFFSKVFLVIVIACIGIAAMRAFKKGEETN